MSAALLSPDLLPANLSHPGRELAACQQLIGRFAEAHRQSGRKMAALQEELQTQKEHSQRLKKELSDACQRDLQEEVAHTGLIENGAEEL